MPPFMETTMIFSKMLKLVTKKGMIIFLQFSEVVYVGLMNHLHYDIVLKALDQGKHVLCEKPFAPNYKQAKTMIDRAKAKKLFLMEGAWSRFFPSWEMLRREIKEKKLGPVKSVFANFGVGNLVKRGNS